MPRSIQQLKHHTIQLANPEQMAGALHILERLSGVTALPEPALAAIHVNYWVDEHTLSELDMELIRCGYPLADDAVPHTSVLNAEEAERSAFEPRAPHCHSCGVFAQTYGHYFRDYEVLPG